MIEWYDDDKLTIFFNHKPNTHMLEPLPSMTQAEKDLIEKYPFINCTALQVAIYDKKKPKMYKFTIPKLFRWDGATISRLVWWIIGSKTNPKYRTPSLCHDYMCLNKYIIDYRCEFSTQIFEALLSVAGVSKWRRKLMCFFINIYQRIFCDWGLEWEKNG